MCAERDFTLPRIAADDIDTFSSLVQDIFPGVIGIRQADGAIEEACRAACSRLLLQPEDGLVQRCLQLKELMQVRHCTFLLGPTGCGKTSVWRTLHAALRQRGESIIVRDLNPKTVSAAELFGCVNSQKEWKDGLLSGMLREMASTLDDVKHKWLLLDGDLDTDWIESMNSLMDDNRVLTLASNERIVLQPSMRLLFETDSLLNATPASVTRAGVICMSSTDIGWFPVVQARFEGKPQQAAVLQYSEKYVQSTLNYLQREAQLSVQFNPVALVTSLCVLCEALMGPALGEKEQESMFALCCVWAFGSPLRLASSDSEGQEERRRFDSFWRRTWKPSKFPPSELGTVFDFVYNVEQKRFERWTESTVKRGLDTTQMTPQLGAASYFLDAYVSGRHPVMVVGAAGTGKTTLWQDRFETLPSTVKPITVYIQSSMSTLELQQTIESECERKVGRTLQPHGQKRLIVCLDDVNYAAADRWGSQSSLELVRQHMDYSHWFERAKWALRDIRNVDYVATMNPSVGSYQLTARLQRHFAVVSLAPPSAEQLVDIFQPVLALFPKHNAERIASLVAEMHEYAVKRFLKTSACFHYDFNLHQLASVYRGLQRASKEDAASTKRTARLLANEILRTYSDSLSSCQDVSAFQATLYRLFLRTFPEGEKNAESEDLSALYFSDVHQGFRRQNHYEEVPLNFSGLQQVLEQALHEYNEVSPVAMDLTLFDEACYHVLRLSRLIHSNGGHVLLMGSGGCGKQSLVRLAAFTVNATVFSPNSASDHPAFRALLKKALLKAGVRGESCVFLVSEQHVTTDAILVDLNQIICSSGEAADLFTPEEKDEIVRKLGPEVRAAFIIDVRENVWEFYLHKLSRFLRIALCCSPGLNIRRWRERFPGLSKNIAVNWVLNWSAKSLESVAEKWIQRMQQVVAMGGEKATEGVVKSLVYMNTAAKNGSVQASAGGQAALRVHVTSKMFFDSLRCFEQLFVSRTRQLGDARDRYATGLAVLKRASEEVAAMQSVLNQVRTVAQQKRDTAEEILIRLNADRAETEIEKGKAQAEEAKATEIQKKVSQQNEECAKDLAEAEPMLRKAKEALGGLSRENLTELKSFKAPPHDVQCVMQCVLALLTNSLPRDRSWNACVRLMQRVDIFMDHLENFDKENISEAALNFVHPLLHQPFFNGVSIVMKSYAAAGLCEWVRNIIEYHRVFWIVKPKRDLVATTESQLEIANQSVARSNQIVAKLKDRLAQVQAQYESAEAEKQSTLKEMQSCESRLALAQRLLSALDNENERWSEEVSKLGGQITYVLGDSLMGTALRVYGGVFQQVEREALFQSLIAFFEGCSISLSPDHDPTLGLATEVDKATWANEGLHSDASSKQNAAIVLSVSPSTVCFLVDPQSQCMEWLRGHFKAVGQTVVVAACYTDELRTVIKKAVTRGDVVVAETADDERPLDPFLSPLIFQRISRTGSQLSVVLDDQEYEYSPNFRLFLRSRDPRHPLSPEEQSAMTVVNFTVSRESLEELLLYVVLHQEKSELEEEYRTAVRAINDLSIRLHELEDSLIKKLSQCSETMLDPEVVASMESLKVGAKDVQAKMQTRLRTRAELTAAMHAYKALAARGSVFFFVVQELRNVDNLYQYSLAWYVSIFEQAISSEALLEGEELQLTTGTVRKRDVELDDEAVQSERLLNALTYQLFATVRKGLFPHHQLLLGMMLSLNITQHRVSPSQLRFLLVGETDARRVHQQQHRDSPVAAPPWLKPAAWTSILAMSEAVEGLERLSADVEAGGKRWKDWYECEHPESERMPGEWRGGELAKLLVVRVMRPDRFLAACRLFVSRTLGAPFVSQSAITMADLLSDCSASLPMLYILYPGGDPAKELEALSKRMSKGGFFNIAMGEGQEEAAIAAIRRCSARGGWVLLQNVHLMRKWLGSLQRLLDDELLKPQWADKDFRLFLTAEPSTDVLRQVPQGVVQRCVKVVHEPPRDFKASLSRAFTTFPSDYLESSAKSTEFKTVLFSLCFFHSVMMGRGLFGQRGWSRPYPFSISDLAISASVLYAYFDMHVHYIPWVDLRFLVGEVLYGGHITDPWDRRVCMTYVEHYLCDKVLTAEGLLCEGVPLPPPSHYAAYLAFIDSLPAETPELFGLHPNAESKHLRQQCDDLCEHMRLSKGSLLFQQDGVRAVRWQEPRDSTDPSQVHSAVAAKVRETTEEILTKLADSLHIEAFACEGGEDSSPFGVVLRQECKMLGSTLSSVRSYIHHLQAAIRGKEVLTTRDEESVADLCDSRVPIPWRLFGHHSSASLRSWLEHLCDRIRHLDAWAADGGGLPRTVWLGGLSCPAAFITAVRQLAARKLGVPLDQLTIRAEVTTKSEHEVTSAPRDGAHVHGLYLEGVRWDAHEAALAEQRAQEDVAPLPVVHLRAVASGDRPAAVASPMAATKSSFGEAHGRNAHPHLYDCPVYTTSQRAQSVLTIQLHSLEPPNKWVLRGACILLLAD